MALGSWQWWHDVCGFVLSLNLAPGTGRTDGTDGTDGMGGRNWWEFPNPGLSQI